ncbi:MAG TPA: tetratricopeptide repeat protein [Planctomycetota bacterium]|mgnify:CR=1 FL=1|jgi:tetratricopeptide (TPR) repeat protein|nr:tetratricopeptide repeat protein [Planctomycetota bacterium]HQB00034.1 tetratricopeptide repeat protein [Planctomycetota bacterium]
MRKWFLIFLFYTFSLSVFSQNIDKIQELYDKGNYDMAEKALSKIENHTISTLDIGFQIYFVQEKYNIALEYANQLIKKNNIRGHLYTAQIQIALGQNKQAFQTLFKAHKQEPDNIPIQTELAYYYYNTGNKENAEQYLSDIFDNFDADETYTPEEWTCISKACYLYAMKYDEVDRSDTLKTIVQDMLPEAIQINPYYFPAYLLLIQIFSDAYNNIDAKYYIEEALKLNTNHPDLKYYQGILQLLKGESIQAQTTFTQLLDTYEIHLPTLHLLIKIALIDEEYEIAYKYIEKALQRNPNDLITLAFQASYFYMNDNMTKYNEVKDKVERINKQYGEFDLIVSDMITHLRKYDESVIMLRQAIKKDPFLWQAYINLGTALMHTGEIKEAESCFQVVYDEYNFHTQTYNMLLLLQEKYKEFKVIKTKNFLFRIHQDDCEFLEPLLIPSLENAFETLTKRYQFTPKTPVIFEMFQTHEDFSVRTTGLDSFGAAGACFGTVITGVSPRTNRIGNFNWLSVAWHEFAHVITLQMTNYNIPRWFTEGLSEFTEATRNPKVQRKHEQELYTIYTANRMRNMQNFNAGFTRPNYPLETSICYFQANLICQYITKTKGFNTILHMLQLYKEGKKDKEVFQIALKMTLEEFDKNFQQWLEENIFQDVNIFPSVDNYEMSELQDLILDEPDNEKYIQRLAQGYLERGKFIDAEMYANKLQKKFPNKPDAYDILGQIYSKQKQHHQAIQTFETAVHLQSKNFYTYIVLGQMYYQTKNFDKAIRTWQQAKESFPNYVGPHNPYLALAHLYKEQENFSSYQEEIEQYIQKDGTDLHTRLVYTEALIGKKQYQNALEILTYCQEINPIHYILQKQLGQTNQALENNDKAIEHYEKSITLYNTQTKHHHHHHGSALEQDTELAPTHYELALLYYSKNNRQKAIEHAKTSLEINPQFEKARQFLIKIQ